MLFVNKTDAANSNGLTDKTTKVSFQPLTKAIITPIINVAINCKQFPHLSPIPSLILFTSLKEKNFYFLFSL